MKRLQKKLHKNSNLLQVFLKNLNNKTQYIMKKATFTGCDDGGIWIGRPCNQPPFLSSAAYARKLAHSYFTAVLLFPLKAFKGKRKHSVFYPGKMIQSVSACLPINPDLKAQPRQYPVLSFQTDLKSDLALLLSIHHFADINRGPTDLSEWLLSQFWRLLHTRGAGLRP